MRYETVHASYLLKYCGVSLVSASHDREEYARLATSEGGHIYPIKSDQKATNGLHYKYKSKAPSHLTTHKNQYKIWVSYFNDGLQTA